MIDGAFPNPNNYVLPAEAERAIDEKSRKLYEKRIAPYALDLPAQQREAIISFQKLIFNIDHYGEHVEKIDLNTLNSFWAQCEKFLNELKIPKATQVILMQDLRDYADIEASTRQGKKLADYEINFFYLKKSCDVRMQRHLIRYLRKELPSSSNDEITRDILEEIEDDVEDMEEDKLTPFNGNRFLEILNSKDNARLQEYITFINSLPNAPRQLVQKTTEKIVSEVSKIF